MKRKFLLLSTLAAMCLSGWSVDRFEVVKTAENGDKVCLEARPMAGAPGASLSTQYQWYKDDEQILGASLSTYVARAAGEYKCLINNRTFTTTSYIVDCAQYGYQVGFKDKSTPHPWENAVCWDQPIKLEVTRWYTGDTVPTEGVSFQWYMYDEDNNLVPIAGATNPTYDATEVGKYTCVVTGEGIEEGLTCTTISLTAKEYPWLFDNKEDNSGDHDWFNKENWYPNRNRIPNIKSNAVIKEGRIAWVGEDKVAGLGVAQTKNLEMRDSSGLVIKQVGRMAVDSTITRTDNTGFITLENGANGYGALTVKDGEIHVNTSVYGYAVNTGTYDNNVVWQYFAVPVNTGNSADEDFYRSWITKWTEAVLAADSTKLGSNWSYIVNGDHLNLFEGYALTQTSVKDYPLSGVLVNKTQTIDGLSYTGENVVEGNVYAGYHLLGNSFCAPIDVAKMEASDFVNAEPTFYLFNYGTWNQWETADSKAGTNAGQYVAIPLNLARAHEIDQTVIPSMQGFYLFTTQPNASVTFDYERAVHKPNLAAETSAPKAFAQGRSRRVENESPIEASVKVYAYSENYYDFAKLMVENECSDLYDAGWDGRKIIGNTNVPQVYFISSEGKMQYSVSNYFDGQCFEVQAGKELNINLQLTSDGVFDNGSELYLHDMTTDAYVDMKEMTEYSYMANKKGEKRRFCITSHNPNKVVTGMDNINIDNRQAGVYDMLGRRIENDALRANDGVYVVVSPDGVRKEVR